VHVTWITFLSARNADFVKHRSVALAEADGAEDTSLPDGAADGFCRSDVDGLRFLAEDVDAGLGGLDLDVGAVHGRDTREEDVEGFGFEHLMRVREAVRRLETGLLQGGVPCLIAGICHGDNVDTIDLTEVGNVGVARDVSAAVDAGSER